MMLLLQHAQGGAYLRIAAWLDVVNVGLWYFTATCGAVQSWRNRSRDESGGEEYYEGKEGEVPC